MIVTKHIVFVFVRFRIPKSDHMNPEAITNERDAWVKAIKQLCVDWKQKSHLEHFYEAPEKDLTDVTESESKTQDNHVPFALPPVPHSLRPRLPRTFPNVPAAFPAAPEPETASREASEAEPKPTLTAQSRAVHKPDRTPSAVPLTSPVATCSSPAPFVLPRRCLCRQQCQVLSLLPLCPLRYPWNPSRFQRGQKLFTGTWWFMIRYQVLRSVLYLEGLQMWQIFGQTSVIVMLL